MELMRVLIQRRAVREFTPDGIDKALLEKLIHAPVLAPSALNRQPWAFQSAVIAGSVMRSARSNGWPGLAAPYWLIAALAQS